MTVVNHHPHNRRYQWRPSRSQVITWTDSVLALPEFQNVLREVRAEADRRSNQTASWRRAQQQIQALTEDF